MTNNNLGVIGFGKMAGAIIKGAVKSGFLKKENIFAYDINKEALDKNAEEIGIIPVYDIKEAVQKCDKILVSTKPFVVSDVIEQIKDYASGKLIISILAGITTETYEKNIKGARIVRVMPNTPAMVNAGMSVVAGGKLANKEDIEFTKTMFSSLGKAICLDESKINAVTAVSGSGPAFYYYIIDTIAKAGEALGLNYEDSLLLSAQTALGAAKMILETKTPPDNLIAAVTTPNGTTAEGNKVLAESNIKEILFKTVEKTNKRAIELGQAK